MFDNLDGAQMVMTCPRTSDFIIVWFGDNVLKMFDETLEMMDIRGFDHSIRDMVHARALAETWFDDLYEDSFDESMDGDHDSAMASAGFGTDEDYGHFSDEY